MQRLRRRDLRPTLDALDDRCLLSGLTPAQVTQAYGLNAITFTNSAGTYLGNGTGQTIALIEAYHDPYLATDLATFDAAEGLPDPSLNVINQAGNQADSGWASEESLDVEWAHAIAPGANILVVEAASQSQTALLAAVNTARNTPGVVAVSMSWGFGETQAQTQYDSTFTTPAGHAGITFVAASGDSGASAGAEWPASSPNVLSVGGTTLAINASGVASGETTWSGSQGGYSLVEAEPSYQQSAQTSGARSTPDVSFDADPNTGVTVYSTSPDTGYGTWQTVGGTSLGAPAWAAIIAIADECRMIAGEGSLDGASQTLPTLYSLPSTDFNSVSSTVTGGNSSVGRYGGGNGGFGGWGGWGFGGFFTASATPFVSTTTAATASYSTTTGLGTPNGPGLINALVTGATTTASSSTSSSSQTTSTPTTTTTATPTTPTSGKKTHAKKTKVHTAPKVATTKKTVKVVTTRKAVTVKAESAKIKATPAIVDAAIEELSPND